MLEVDYTLKKTILYEEIANRLENVIISDVNKVGEKLPAEQSIAEKFGVSRNVVREAFKILRERGLITVRTGDGAYISAPEEDILSDMLRRYLSMQQISAYETYEMRKLLEGYAARCATEHVNAEDIAEMRNLNEQMKCCVGDRELRIKLDIAFHRKVARLSGNALLIMFVGSMADLKRSTIFKAIKTEEGSKSGTDYHEAIINAIEQRDGEEAERLMRAHLNESQRQYIIIDQRCENAKKEASD